MWVLTAGKGEELEGSSVTWVTQTSFAPPLVMVAEVIETHQAFALHLPTAGQRPLAESFTRPTAGKIGGIPFKPGAQTGAPILEGFAAWFEAKLTDIVAQVVDAGLADEKAEPLVLAQVGWHYGG